MPAVWLFLFLPSCSLYAQLRLPTGVVGALSLAQQEALRPARNSMPQPVTGRELETQASSVAADQTPAQPPAGLAQAPASGEAAQANTVSQGRQSHRILGIFPNFSSVDADIKLPPQTAREKFWIATENSFDYSAFILAGFQAGVAQASDAYPEFQHGGKAFGRYYWHAFADQTVGNYVVGAIFPAVTREDTRYYTLFHGGFWRRATYAFSRIVVTRKDDGSRTFNYSEILGNGATAAITPNYYPSRERNWNEYGQRWATTVAMDGVFNILQEFWPNIRRKILGRQ
ncbi:MAG: hypothetical protein ACRD4K_06765 [Candidatus Acidiferrales bacterium]